MRGHALKTVSPERPALAALVPSGPEHAILHDHLAAPLDQLAEQVDPAFLVAVARRLIEELLTMQREQRAVAIRLQRDRELRLALRRRMPRPAEHQPLVRHDFAIDAADLEMLAVGGLEADLVAPADAQVGLRLQRAFFHPCRAEPSDYFFRVGPRGVDFRGRRIDTTFDVEAWLGC